MIAQVIANESIDREVKESAIGKMAARARAQKHEKEGVPAKPERRTLGVRVGVGAHSLPFCLNPSLVLFLQPQPKYFHSAAILDDFMVVFGGRSNTNDQLFSRQLLVYNVKCNYWQLLSGIGHYLYFAYSRAVTKGVVKIALTQRIFIAKKNQAIEMSLLGMLSLVATMLVKSLWDKILCSDKVITQFSEIQFPRAQFFFSSFQPSRGWLDKVYIVVEVGRWGVRRQLPFLGKKVVCPVVVW